VAFPGNCFCKKFTADCSNLWEENVDWARQCKIEKVKNKEAI